MVNTNTLDLLLRAIESRPLDQQLPLTPPAGDTTRYQVRAAPPVTASLPEGGVVGTVVDRLGDSVYRVFIAGQSYRLTLPSQPSLTAGDTLVLQFGAVGQSSSEISKASVGSLERETVVPPASSAQGLAPADGTTGNRSVSMRLSDVGLWLANAPNKASGKTPASIHTDSPLLPAPSELSVDIGHALQHAISKSGLFYESHVAAWAVQDYPKSALGIEPQGHLNAQARVIADMLAPSAATQSPSTPSAALDAHHALPPLVREQLQALESNSLIWQGELWPGQKASVEIAEDDSNSQPELDSLAPASAWRVQVKLDLPGLGLIDATLALSGDSVQIRINSTKQGTADALRAAIPDFADVMRRRELTLESILVKNESA